MPLAISCVETARRSSDQNELADQFRTVEGNLLRDHAAEGEAEKVDLLQPQSIVKGLCILRHACEGGGHLTGRAGDACIVEYNDFALFGEVVKDGQIPIVQIAVEVVVENKWQPAPLAPTPVRETNAVRLNKLRWGRDCCIGAHGAILFSLWLKSAIFRSCCPEFSRANRRKPSTLGAEPKRWRSSRDTPDAGLGLSSGSPGGARRSLSPDRAGP